MLFYIVFIIFLGITLSIIFNKLLDIYLNKISLFFSLPIIFVFINMIIIIISFILAFYKFDIFILIYQSYKIIFNIYLFYVLLIMIPLNIGLEGLTLKLYNKKHCSKLKFIVIFGILIINNIFSLFLVFFGLILFIGGW